MGGKKLHMPYAKIDEIELFYKDLGSGRALVLVPPLGADSTAYNFIIPFLRDHLRLIAFDPRGLGRSGPPPESLCTHLLARDIVGLMDWIGIERATILGTSMGGLVVRRFAALFPHRMEAAIFCATGKGDTPYLKNIRRLIRVLVKEAPSDDLFQYLFTLMVSSEFMDEKEDFIRAISSMLRVDEGLRRTMLMQLELLDREAAEDIPPFNVPALFIAGEKDMVTPLRYVRELERSLPKSRLVVIDGAAHHLLLEAPEQTSMAILGFMESLGGTF